MSDSEFVDMLLDLAEFDELRAAAAVREQETRGITFTTLSEEQVRRPEAWLTELADLDNATRAHLGHPPRTPEAMRERLAFLRIAPEALFVAREGERYAGYTCLNVLDSDDRTVMQSWTGVRPEARRRGLATALKLLGAAYAKARGYERILTSPRRTNAASLRANEKVGFRPATGTEADGRTAARTVAQKLRAPASKEDWAAYHAIRRHVLFELRGQGSTYDANHPDDGRPDNHPLILWADDVAVGVIRIDVRASVATFRRVAIRADLQRRGHGRRLLEGAERFARAHGCTTVESHVDPSAVGFYLRCGYAQFDREEAGSSVLMGKVLDTSTDA